MKSFWIALSFFGLCLPALSLDREAFTFTKYDLQVQIEPEQQRIGARGKITLRNDSSQPQKIAVLQISSSLDWRSVKIDGKPVQFVSQSFVSDVDHTGALSEAIVTLPAEVKPKDSVEIEVGYEGTIPLDTTRLSQVGVPDSLAKHTSWDQISPSFTAVRGAGYVAWYPIATESADFSEGNGLFEVVERWKSREAESEFKANIGVTGEKGEGSVVTCAPGKSELLEGKNPAQAAGVECSSQRLGVAAPGFVIAKYKNDTIGEVAINSLAGNDNGAATYAGAVGPASRFVADWFGQPGSVVAIADMADAKAAPFESGKLLLTSMAADDSKLAEINTIHMLVHSAFSSPRPWIDEGLAHFAEALYCEKTDGRLRAINLLGAHQGPLVDAEKEVAGSPEKNPGKPLAATFDEVYYRTKAAYVWWMLRDMIGDDAVKQAIHNYKPQEDTDPKYVQKLVQSASKRDLSWFFDDWVYQDHGLPDFRVQSVHPWKTDAGTQVVTVTLENQGTAGAEIPFAVQCADGEVTRRLEIRAKSTATTRVEVPCGTPERIVVNDGSVPETDLTNNIFKISE